MAGPPRAHHHRFLGGRCHFDPPRPLSLTDPISGGPRRREGPRVRRRVRQATEVPHRRPPGEGRVPVQFRSLRAMAGVDRAAGHRRGRRRRARGGGRDHREGAHHRRPRGRGACRQSWRRSSGRHLLHFGQLAEVDALALLARAPNSTLTVGETTRFLRDGGMVRLFIEDQRLRFQVNRGRTAAAGLQLSSQLLSLAAK